MEYLSLPYITLGLASLLGGAVACWRATQPRRAALMAAAFACICFLGAAKEVAAGHDHLVDPWLACFAADSLGAVPMAFYAALTLMVIVLAPQRDAGGRSLAGLLLISVATEMAYAAADWITLALGWWLSCLPLASGMLGGRRNGRLAKGIFITGCVALTAAVVVMRSMSSDDLLHRGGGLAFGLLVGAVMFRKGLFPLHAGMVRLFEAGALLPMALLFNGHLGVLALARPEAAALSADAGSALDVLVSIAAASVLLTSVRAFAEKKPRRLLAFLCISQAGFMLAGIAAANVIGVTGALVHWLVVAVASTGLICVVRVLEVRIHGAEDSRGHLGLAVKAPRLATFFLICGLTLVGLPGMLGFCSEDLIFQGVLANHFWAGVALLLATAFNAINLLRLFSILFLGVLPKHVSEIPDALPRERWPLATCAVFLVVGGLLPDVIVGWRSSAAHAFVKARGMQVKSDH